MSGNKDVPVHKAEKTSQLDGLLGDEEVKLSDEVNFEDAGEKTQEGEGKNSLMRISIVKLGKDSKIKFHSPAQSKE